MDRPRILDLFSGAGGSAAGLHRAGFEVVGVDIVLQKHYPFEFHLGDAMTYPLEGFDAYWASPPCQGYSTMKNMKHQKEYPLLIESIRRRLSARNKPYIIENVIGARRFMITPILLCGQMFGLRLFRHRLFECSFEMLQLGHTHGSLRAPSKGPNCEPLEGEVWSPIGHFANLSGSQAAMGIDWMTRAELSQAIPPAYSQFLGDQLMQHLRDRQKELAC